MVSETYVLFIDFYEVLGLDVCDEHGHADLRRGLLDVVRCPVGILILHEAKDVLLISVTSEPG